MSQCRFMAMERCRAPSERFALRTHATVAAKESRAGRREGGEEAAGRPSRKQNHEGSSLASPARNMGSRRSLPNRTFGTVGV